MVVVLISFRYKKILQWIQEEKYDDISHIGVIKKVGARIFLYVETNLNYKEVENLFTKVIIKNSGMMFVFQFYGIYNGKIDYYSHVNSETKDNLDYYKLKHKDITDEEIKEYLSNPARTPEVQ